MQGLLVDMGELELGFDAVLEHDVNVTDFVLLLGREMDVQGGSVVDAAARNRDFVVVVPLLVAGLADIEGGYAVASLIG